MAQKFRQLTFDATDEGRERFFFVLQGYMLGGSQPSAGGGRKNMMVVEREADILRKFRKLATEDEMPQLAGEGVVLLSESEFQIVRDHYDAAQWATAVSIKVVDVWHWLLAAPLIDEAEGG